MFYRSFPQKHLKTKKSVDIHMFKKKSKKISPKGIKNIHSQKGTVDKIEFLTSHPQPLWFTITDSTVFTEVFHMIFLFCGRLVGKKIFVDRSLVKGEFFFI